MSCKNFAQWKIKCEIGIKKSKINIKLDISILLSDKMLFDNILHRKSKNRF